MSGFRGRMEREGSVVPSPSARGESTPRAASADASPVECRGDFVHGLLAVAEDGPGGACAPASARLQIAECGQETDGVVADPEPKIAKSASL